MVIIVTCSPFFTALISALLKIETLSLRRLISIIVAFFGVFLIVGDALSGANLKGLLLAIAGTLSFSLGTIYFRKNCSHESTLLLNFWQTALSCIILGIISLFNFKGINISPTSLFSLLYLAIVVSIGGMALWFYLINTHGTVLASMSHLLNPFFGVSLSHIFFNTGMYLKDFVAIFIICGAIIINLDMGKNKKRKSGL